MPERYDLGKPAKYLHVMDSVLIWAIIDAQYMHVDIVASAIVTSNGLRNAVLGACQKAAGKGCSTRYRLS